MLLLHLVNLPSKTTVKRNDFGCRVFYLIKLCLLLLRLCSYGLHTAFWSLNKIKEVLKVDIKPLSCSLLTTDIRSFPCNLDTFAVSDRLNVFDGRSLVCSFDMWSSKRTNMSLAGHFSSNLKGWLPAIFFSRLSGFHQRPSGFKTHQNEWMIVVLAAIPSLPDWNKVALDLTPPKACRAKFAPNSANRSLAGCHGLRSQNRKRNMCLE